MAHCQLQSLAKTTKGHTLRLWQSHMHLGTDIVLTCVCFWCVLHSEGIKAINFLYFASFGSALKKAASRDKIKEGRTACKLTSEHSTRIKRVYVQNISKSSYKILKSRKKKPKRKPKWHWQHLATDTINYKHVGLRAWAESSNLSATPRLSNSARLNSRVVALRIRHHEAMTTFLHQQYSSPGSPQAIFQIYNVSRTMPTMMIVQVKCVNAIFSIH